MFEADGYLKNLTVYKADLAMQRDAAQKAGNYARAGELHGIYMGVGAAIARSRNYIKPDPAPVQPNSDKALDEFVDWLAAKVALTNMSVMAAVFSGNDDSPAQHELTALRTVVAEIKRLAKKYPTE